MNEKEVRFNEMEKELTKQEIRKLALNLVDGFLFVLISIISIDLLILLIKVSPILTIVLPIISLIAIYLASLPLRRKIKEEEGIIKSMGIINKLGDIK